MQALPLSPKSLSAAVAVDSTLAVAQLLGEATLSSRAADEIQLWAGELAQRSLAGISDLEHVLVAKALRDKAGQLPDNTLNALKQVHRDSVTARTGQRVNLDRVDPLPASAITDRRARVLQNAVFESRGLFAGYVPKWSDALLLGATAALAVVAPAVTLALGAGIAISSAVEHQVHVHVMHPRPAVARFFNEHRKNPLVSNAANFFFIHKLVHHGETFHDDATTKWEGDSERKAANLLRGLDLEKFGQETDSGLQLTRAGAIAGATVGMAAVSLAGVVAGLAVAPAIALGLPMVLMPFFPHKMHRFSHMSRTKAAGYLNDVEAKGGVKRLESRLIRRIIGTRAFEAIARFHNAHHAADRHGVKTNMSMLAVADGLLLSGSRAGYDMLVRLWTQDAVGFPAAPAAQPA